MKIFDLPSQNWPKLLSLEDPVDRSGIIVREYLQARGVSLTLDPHDADLMIRKVDPAPQSKASVEVERKTQSAMSSIPHIVLLPEPREFASAAYRWASPENTLAAAPGTEFKRLFTYNHWKDPKIDSWRKRHDRICWIDAPTPEKLALARRMIELGLDVDIYSDQPWSIPSYKGRPTPETALTYRYQIIYEDSHSNLYHSGKLFEGFRNGCVCFYSADPNLSLPFLQGCYLPLELEAMHERREMSSIILANMNSVMHTSAWEVYSLRAFLDQILILARHQLVQKRPNEIPEWRVLA